ncbi:hypothetical protein ACQP2E_30705 [Actinoplanes sp. CA-015351]|uniref:hypothetical protein n=1 Tax=Actinoplanes sp. CA-015351 TaxID=3239897 RepID=UPI003D99864F
MTYPIDDEPRLTTWRSIVDKDSFGRQLADARRRHLRRLTDQEKVLRFVNLGTLSEQLDPGAGFTPDSDVALDLIVYVGNAAAAGLIGNALYDILKGAAKRARGGSGSVVSALDEDEAIHAARDALSVFRRGCSFFEDPATYHVVSAVMMDDEWIIRLSLDHHDVMPFAITLKSGWNEKDPKAVKAKVW